MTSRGRYAFLAEEHRRGENENGRVDEEGDGESDDGIDGVEADGAADGRFVLLQLAALDEGGVQIEIVRHHGGADDTDRDIQHSNVAEMRGDEGSSHLEEAGLSLRKDKNLDEVTDGDGCDQHKHDGFDGAHAEALQGEKQ